MGRPGARAGPGHTLGRQLAAVYRTHSSRGVSADELLRAPVHGARDRLIESGVVTRAEVESGRADPAAVQATPALTPAVARELLFRTPQTEQDIELTPRFHVGDRVRGQNIHPTTHTRMPRYTRGKTGVVERDRGVFHVPDREHAWASPSHSTSI